jgi:hypothetical protein
MDIRLKSCREIKIWEQVWAWWASARANQHELTTSTQKGGY